MSIKKNEKLAIAESDKHKQDDLLGLIVHSYNNYLAGSMGYSELALLECDDINATNGIAERINNSLDSGRQAVHFGQSILASLGRLQVAIKPCKLQSVFQLLEEDLIEKKIIIDTCLNDDVVININLPWFKECLVDLLDFILFYSDQSPIIIKIHLLQEQQKVEIELINSEINLTEIEQVNLFIPYYSSRNMLGTKDLGLAKAKGFFEQMKIDLQWNNGRGFSLVVAL